ncbi:MAG TPA: histidine kinase dimerization/phospho-acceptor domain-containing protein [Limnobacter sp.]|nr:histidine kinase dimerization/phospho-acceptor domain-containing protein [Limnobacter sp.]
MNSIVADFIYAASVISDAQLSGLAFGFFASLLAMTVAVEVRIKNPPIIANSHYLVRRGVLITLYVISMFFASAFVGLTLPSAKSSMFSLTGTFFTFVGCIAVFLYVDYLVQSAKFRAKLFMLLFTSLGIFVQFGIHACFIFLPNDQKIMEVHWGGLAVMYIFLFVFMGMLSSFAQQTSAGGSKPLRDRMFYIFGIVGLNQMIALSLIGLVYVDDGIKDLNWYGLWVNWSAFEVVVSLFALGMISIIVCYVYTVFEKSVSLLKEDKQQLQALTDDAVARAEKASEKLKQEQDKNVQLEKAVLLANRTNQMSVDSLVAALSSLEDGMFEWDIEQEEVMFSPVWLRLFGLDNLGARVVSAASWRAGFLPEDLPFLDDALQRSLTAEGKGVAVKLRYRSTYGSLLKLEIRIVAVRNAYGLPAKAVGILYDRTEEMDLEMAIREELNEESLLSSRKSQFVAYLSHEIRTPMTVIGSAKALLENTLRRTPLNLEAAQTYVDQIGTALRALRALVDETLMFMGSSFSRKNLHITALNVSSVFKQFAALEQRRRHGEHWFDFALDPQLDTWNFYSDEYVLTQALRQLTIFSHEKDSFAGQVEVTRTEEGALMIRIELLQWPEWMVRSGQLQPAHAQESVVPFKGEHLPFTLLLTKRVIRLVDGRLMIKNKGNQHWLCVDLPSMKEDACPAS